MRRPEEQPVLSQRVPLSPPSLKRLSIPLFQPPIARVFGHAGKKRLRLLPVPLLMLVSPQRHRVGNLKKKKEITSDPRRCLHVQLGDK